MTIKPQDIAVGMEVRGSDRVTVGRVQAVGKDQFRVERPYEPPCVLPFTAIREISDGVITLMLTAREVGDSSPPTADLHPPFQHIRVRAGMLVVGSDGVEIGRVRETAGDRFLLDWPLERDVYVPFDLINDIRDERIVLDVPASQLKRMDLPVA